MLNKLSSTEKSVFAIVVLLIVALFGFADTWFVERFGKISTPFLAILTAGYVLLTYWILKSSQRSTKEQNRPFVIASLPLEGFELFVSVKNIGNRPAKNVSVAFEPSMETLAGPEFKSTVQPLLSQTFMAPEFEVRNPVALTPEIIKLERGKKVFRVTIIYFDLENQSFTSQYTIDLNTYVYKDMVARHGVEHYLDAISGGVKKISDHIGRHP